MTSISDDFNRANNASLGASWTDYGAGSALRVQSNTCQQTTTATNGASRHNTAMAVPHWARATVTLNATGDCQCAALVRCDTGGISFYIGAIDRTSSVVTAKIIKVVAGTPTELASVAYGATTGVVTFYATGTTTTVLTLAVDGVQVTTASDSSTPLSTQTRAGALCGGTIATLDDFSGSDVATAPLAPTGVTATAGDTTIALAWTAPFNGMAAITDYIIEYSTDGSSWTTFAEGVGTGTTTTITGLTNGTPYFTRVSAVNSTGTGAAAQATVTMPYPQVTFIGAGAWSPSTTDGAAVAADYPSAYTAVHGDIAIVIAAGLHNNTTSLAPTAPAGYTQITTQFQNIATYDIQITAYIRVLQTGDAAPTVTLPTAYSTSSGGMACHMLVFRNADPVTSQDAAAVVSSGAAAASFAPTGITTVTEGAMVVSMVVTGDDNLLDLLAGSTQGFTLRAGGANYDTTTGGDHAVGSATRSGALPTLSSQAAAPAQLTTIDTTAGTAFVYRWTGSGVTIFCAGGGIRGTHNEFTGRLGTGYAVAAASGADPFTDNAGANASFPKGHDTAVASVAAGTTYGVAKLATIYPITSISSAEAVGADLTKCMPAARVIDSINHVLVNGVAGRSVVVWSNVGHASGDTDYFGGTITAQNITDMTAVFQAVLDKGIPIVVAAGNQASDTYIAAHFPMNMAGVINVGNIDAVTQAKSTTSNFGAGITIWAPGSGTGTQSAGDDSNSDVTGAFNGTSEAAPITAGVVAAMLQAHPSLTPAQVKALLLANATTATGSVGVGSTTKLLNSLAMPDGGIGASLAPTWSETAVGNDAWAAITVALRCKRFIARQAPMGNVPVMRALTR